MTTELPQAPAWATAAAAAQNTATDDSQTPQLPGTHITPEDAAAAAAEDKVANEAANADTVQPVDAGQEPASKDGEPAKQADGVPAMPEGGKDKFYNKETGEYDWSAHGKESAYNDIRRGQKDDKAKPADGDTPPTEAEVAAALPEGTWDKINDEFADTGDISEESREALRKVGVTNDVINDHLAFKAWEVEQARAQVFEAVDPKFDAQDFQLLQKWVLDNKQPAEIARIDKLLADVDTAPMIIKELVGEAAMDLGGPAKTAAPLSERTGQLVQPGNHQPGQARSAAGLQPFSSFSAMSQAMGDPRYGRDAEYTAQVDARAKATPVSQGSGGQFV